MISDRIKELRNQHNLTQKQLANALETSRSTINAWESGYSLPGSQYVIEMSKIFHVSCDTILDNTDGLDYVDITELDDNQKTAIRNIVDTLVNSNNILKSLNK